MVPSVQSKLLIRNVSNVAILLTRCDIQEFFVPSEAYDLSFLKSRIVVLCAKGFELIDLDEYVSFF